MIVKSILQWRERQSESFGERILQALKGPCGSSTPHSACVVSTHARSVSVIVADRLHSALPIRPADLYASARLGCNSLRC